MRKLSLILLSFFVLTATLSRADNKYGLKDNIQDGVILHCFDWTVAQIQEELPNIAAAGFTAVQTSPVHQHEGQSSWYMAYQPYDFYVGNSICGSDAELTALCDSAHKYGIKIIVDVVANHTNGSLTYVADRLKDTNLYHDYTGDINYSNRWQITHGKIGMWDLKTEDATVQSYIKAYVQELKSCGVDGIRWDAAKHIGLPSEGDDFWKNVPDQSMYNYGEILGTPVNGSYSLLNEYANYISFTDDVYGDNMRSSFAGGSVNESIGVDNQNGVATNKLVYWAESHDTYSNDGGASKNVGQNVIDRTWAVVANNNEATALYLSRPFETSKDAIKMGVKGSTHFTSPEVAEVNHVHNICAGEPNYYIHSGNVAAQVRKSGATIALGSGSDQDVSFDNGDRKGNYLSPGQYTDMVTKTNVFTVTTSTISGHVGSTGIAVIYKGNVASITLSPNGGTFTSSTLDVTITPNNNTTSYWYQVGSGDKTNVTGNDATTVTIGDDLSYGQSVTLSWGAANSDGEETTGTASFTKADPNVKHIYVKSDATPSIYVWNGSTIYTNAFPGNSMSSVTLNGKNFYTYELPSSVTSYNFILSYGSNTTQTGDLSATGEKYYFFMNNNAIDLSDKTYDPVTTTSFQTDSIYGYIKGSGNYYAYVWNGDNNNDWPGKQATNTNKSVSDFTIYRYKTTGLDFTPSKVIWDTGSNACQTSNLTYYPGGYYFWNGSHKDGGSEVSKAVSAKDIHLPVFGSSEVAANRTFTANNTSTFALPFTLTDDQVNALDGTVYKMKEYDDDGILHFEEATSVEAFKPYLFVANSNVQPFKNLANQVWQPGTAIDEVSNGFHFASQMGPKRDFISNNDTTYYGYKDGQFVKVGTSKGMHTNGYRCYFYILNNSTGAKPKTIVVEDGTATGISSVKASTVAADNDIWYNLQGQRVNRPQHGIYIHNGKKTIIK